MKSYIANEYFNVEHCIHIASVCAYLCCEHRKFGKWDVALEATDSRAKEIWVFRKLE